MAMIGRPHHEFFGFTQPARSGSEARHLAHVAAQRAGRSHSLLPMIGLACASWLVTVSVVMGIVAVVSG
jgi:hypothetical protein